MPCRQSRSDTGRGPGDRSGHGGSNGSISAHKSSSTIHGRVLTPSRTAESSHHHERPSPHTGHGQPAHFNKIVHELVRLGSWHRNREYV